MGGQVTPSGAECDNGEAFTISSKMKSRFLFCLVAVAVLLAGCSGSVLLIFNNTGQDLTVLSYDTKDHPVKYVIKSGASHKVASPTKLVVKSATNSWEYADFPKLERRYRGGGGTSPRTFTLQIESDGGIYILDAGTKKCVTELTQQPNGFPVRPK